MKIHAPTYTPPPLPPPAPPPTTARNDLQLASTKAPMAFDQSLEAKASSDQPAQAGYKSRGNRGGAGSSRLSAPAPTNPPSAAAVSAAASEAPSADKPYAPGSIVDIEA
jgi:hypothetical protein